MNSEIGDVGEKIAADFAVKQGYKIRGTNFRRPYGELDIIAEKDGIIHFIEVKTSEYYPDSAFLPEIRVDARKVRNLKKICETYLRETLEPEDRQWQIDVVSVILNPDNTINELNFIENAVFEKRY